MHSILEATLLQKSQGLIEIFLVKFCSGTSKWSFFQQAPTVSRWARLLSSVQVSEKTHWTRLFGVKIWFKQTCKLTVRIPVISLSGALTKSIQVSAIWFKKPTGTSWRSDTNALSKFIWRPLVSGQINAFSELVCLKFVDRLLDWEEHLPSTPTSRVLAVQQQLCSARHAP